VCKRDWINGVWYNHFLFIQIERTAHLINIHNGGRHMAQLWIYLFFFLSTVFFPQHISSQDVSRTEMIGKIFFDTKQLR